jgi:hypothetical protein
VRAQAAARGVKRGRHRTRPRRCRSRSCGPGDSAVSARYNGWVGRLPPPAKGLQQRTRGRQHFYKRAKPRAIICGGLIRQQIIGASGLGTGVIAIPLTVVHPWCSLGAPHVPCRASVRCTGRKGPGSASSALASNSASCERTTHTTAMIKAAETAMSPMPIGLVTSRMALPNA